MVFRSFFTNMSYFGDPMNLIKIIMCTSEFLSLRRFVEELLQLILVMIFLAKEVAKLVETKFCCHHRFNHGTLHKSSYS